ncbi:MAG: 4-(cytidine 5'-diphospho)-2-C-methyl-D-erythritol kinase [Patescibacteria group bacterium]
MKVKAFAKINLGLRVLAKRKDGYHNIDTLFAEVELADELTIKVRKDGEIHVSGIDVPDQQNSVFQAAWLLQKFAEKKLGADIIIEKKIPIEAGLGGGSSDAAATLKVLNKLWKLKLAEKRLEHLAVKLGADTPFFIRGGTQRGRGIGDRLSEYKLPKTIPREVVIIVPGIPVATKWAYEHIELPQKWVEFEPGDLTNDFEKLLFPQLPLLKKIKAALKRAGAAKAALSGSGSALYGLFKSKKAAKEAAEKLGKYGEIFVTKIK